MLLANSTMPASPHLPAGRTAPPADSSSGVNLAQTKNIMQSCIVYMIVSRRPARAIDNASPLLESGRGQARKAAGTPRLEIQLVVAGGVPAALPEGELQVERAPVLQAWTLGSF
jgi:hypothetical protein